MSTHDAKVREPHDVKRARKLLDSDPEHALKLLQRHPISGLHDAVLLDRGRGRIPSKTLDEAFERSDLRVELYERCGRHEEAEAERAEAAGLRELLEHPIHEPPTTSLLDHVSDLGKSDPHAALALLEDYPSTLNYLPYWGVKVADLRAELCAQSGQHQAAEQERAQATRFREQLLDSNGREIADYGRPGFKPKLTTPTLWMLLTDRARLLEQLGRTTEAARARLAAADVELAKDGDAGAKANLAGLAWGTAGATAAAPTLGAVRGAGAGLEFADAFAAGFRYGASMRKEARGWQEDLVHQGRAIPLTQCDRCGGVVEAAMPKGGRLECAAGHRVREVRVVVMQDAPPGWYADPWMRFTQRRWDGDAWTSEVIRDGTPTEDPPGTR